jgi:putative transposase
MRVARSRVLVAEGYALATVARVRQVSRQALYRVPHPRRAPACRRPADGSVEAAIVEVAKANPTDGYRLVTAWVARKLGVAVNRKRVLRVMREQEADPAPPPRAQAAPAGVLQGRAPRAALASRPDERLGRRARLGVLNAIIDCCTREIVGWRLSLRCRAAEAITVIEHAVLEQGIAPGTLTLGTDNGSAFTARATRLVSSGLGVTHRRGGYRDPESQAFIESWFRYLKERCVWRNELETLDQAREVIAAYIDHYHDRPHSRLDYRTPREVRATWDDAQEALLKDAA